MIIALGDALLYPSVNFGLEPPNGGAFGVVDRLREAPSSHARIDCRTAKPDAMLYFSTA